MANEPMSGLLCAFFLNAALCALFPMVRLHSCSWSSSTRKAWMTIPRLGPRALTKLCSKSNQRSSCRPPEHLIAQSKQATSGQPSRAAPRNDGGSDSNGLGQWTRRPTADHEPLADYPSATAVVPPPKTNRLISDGAHHAASPSHVLH